MKTEKNTGTIAFRFRQVLLYFIPPVIIFAQSPKFTVNSSESNFASLSAEHISDPVSNQYHR